MTHVEIMTEIYESDLTYLYNGIMPFCRTKDRGPKNANLRFLYRYIGVYAGTWKYINSSTNEEFSVKLKISSDGVTFNSVHYSMGCLVGAYEYKKNGQTVVTCMDKYDLQIPVNSMPVYATNGALNTTPNPNELYMYVVDNGVNKTTFSNSLTIVSATNPKQIRWVLKNDEGEYEASECPPAEFSIPVDIILTKVE